MTQLYRLYQIRGGWYVLAVTPFDDRIAVTWTRSRSDAAQFPRDKAQAIHNSLSRDGRRMTLSRVLQPAAPTPAGYIEHESQDDATARGTT